MTRLVALLLLFHEPPSMLEVDTDVFQFVYSDDLSSRISSLPVVSARDPPARISVMALVLTISLVLFASALTYALNSFYTNYRIAQSTGLPILFHPTDTLNPLWLLTKDFLSPFLQKFFPDFLSAWTCRAFVGWNYYDKYKTHAWLASDAFMIVTPGENECHIADPVAADDVVVSSLLPSPSESACLVGVCSLIVPRLTWTERLTIMHRREVEQISSRARKCTIRWKSLGEA